MAGRPRLRGLAERGRRAAAARSAAREAARAAAPDDVVLPAAVPIVGADEQSPPLTVALDQRRLRQSTIAVLAIVTVWLFVVWLFSAVGHFLFLLLLAWLVAIAMEPVISRLIRGGMRRGLATTVAGGGAILVGLIIVGVFGATFIAQLADLVQSIPALVTSTIDWLNSTFNTQLNAAQVTERLQVTPTQAADWASNVAGGVLGWFGSLVAVLFDVFTVAVFAFYFAAAGPRLFQALAVWLPPERQRVAGTVWEIAATKTGGYVISKVELAALSTAFHAVFFLAIGVPSWLPMALLVGITAQFIPVVGTYIGVVIPVLVAVFDKPINGVWIVVFALVYQQIETYFFTPRVSRRTMDVHPAIALGSVFVGAAVWGPLGALIGIPIAAVVVSLAETYGRRYRVVRDAAPAAASDAVSVPASSVGTQESVATQDGVARRAAGAGATDAAVVEAAATPETSPTRDGAAPAVARTAVPSAGPAGASVAPEGHARRDDRPVPTGGSTGGASVTQLGPADLAPDESQADDGAAPAADVAGSGAGRGTASPR